MKMKKIVGVVMTLSMLCVTATSAFAATPVYQNGFDGDLGAAQVMTREGDNENGGNAGTMPVVNDSVAAVFAEGKNDQALSLDGKYGVVLDTAAVGDTYTISFWVNPTRFSQFGPIVQIGSDLLSANASSKWVNFTKTDWDGDSCPIIWSRNEVNGAWPWYLKAYFSAGGGYIIPKAEWTHITLTVDGTKVGMDPVLATEVVGTLHSQLYINGELIGEGPIASETFTGDSKVYLGINCWDINFKGFFDDIKLYNTVLTADEVKTAMNEPATASAAAESTTTTDVPKTGVASTALIFGLGAAFLGTGSVVLKKKEK